MNALRGHLAEFGIVVAQGPVHLRESAGFLEADRDELPDAVKEMARIDLDQIDILSGRIEDLASGLRTASEEQIETRRLCTVPGVGPVTAGAIMAFAPDLRTFASGRNFAAWLGLVPRQRSTGGKTRHGGVSKMGQTDIRTLLILGAMGRIRWIVRKGVMPDNWLGRVVARKPRMVVAVALANKMARNIWAMMTTEQNYRMA
jgi:transposase